MTYPWLRIDLDMIEHNSRTLVALCGKQGITVTGVTKAVCGNPEVANAMLRGGVASIADSRLENIHRMQAAGVAAAFMLLWLPPLTGADIVVETAGLSLNSELCVLEALSAAAARRGLRHDVILMLDLGDLREGILPADLMPFVQQAVGLPGVRIVGIGTNLACFSGVPPGTANMRLLAQLADAIEQRFGISLQWVSGINSSGLGLLSAGHMPARINHARLGESILLGRETLHRRPWPGTFQDAFLLHAEVLELKRKPSLPAGERCEDAFGQHPLFEDRGEIKRALLNIGREDVDIAGIQPTDARLRVIGASSGYLALDAGAAGDDVRVGSEIAFTLNYAALVATMTSEYVKKRLISGNVN